MIRHMYQRDWCATRSPRLPFVDEVDIDNSVTERILRNKFWDPMISSDEEEPVGTIDWKTVFKKKIAEQQNCNNYVPGCRKQLNHPKLSSLTKNEQYQMIKVLCMNNDVLPKKFLGKVCKADFRVFEEKKDIYAEEQKQYLDWAKNLWVSTNCIRALRPKPPIEAVYEAELKMKELKLKCFPKKFTIAAQIPLKSEKHKCELLMPKIQLVEANISTLPEVYYPPITNRKYSILQKIGVPEPCPQHPCKFKLPNESVESLLPLTEIHNELAQYALENGSGYIASESAIRCLLEIDRSWTVPISVCQVLDPDGERSNIVVLGSEIPMKKDAPPTRTYKAYKHMLQKAFTVQSFRNRTFSDCSLKSSHSMSLRTDIKCSKDSANARNSKGKPTRNCGRGAYTAKLRKIINKLEDSDDSDDDRLLIDCRGDSPRPEEAETLGSLEKGFKATDNECDYKRSAPELGSSPPKKIQKVQPIEFDEDQIELYDCVCKDTDFQSPPQRSFRNVQIKNATTKELINVIIHCSHKLKNDRGNEVILEPIVEYQLDVGATAQSRHKLCALAFSLMLRRNANLINVRVDGVTGEVVSVQTECLRSLSWSAGDCRAHVAACLHAALGQLAGLLPGHYLLAHDPSLGNNAALYSARTGGAGGDVTMDFAELSAAEEARLVQVVPNLAPVMLPIHKHRRMLPLAFTYENKYVTKETIKPGTRVKQPPPALLYPKKGKKRGRKKKVNHNYEI